MNGLTFLTPATFAVDFYPFSETRDAADLLWGGRTLGEQWAGQIPSPRTLNPLWIPSPESVELVRSLAPGTGWTHQGEALAEHPLSDSPTRWLPLPTAPDVLTRPTDLFLRCGEALSADWERTAEAWGAVAERDWPVHVTVIGPTDRLRAHPSARALACTFNTEAGPIVLGPGVEVQEGAHLRGPLALGAGTVVKMACRIAGPSAFGPECRLGGELSNVVMHGYSNKGHDGFLGNSVIGSWCNLGADTNSSNLKSNYSPVRIWHHGKQAFEQTDLQFCGLLMGDHAKCSINTMFNTATTVGTAAQVIGSGFPPKHVPSFSWGGAEGFDAYDFERFVRTAEAVMARRNLEPTADDRVRWAAAHQAAQG
jgi:UDP-N-acetylglucosamine diphosphorylase/glucosamine-1-phosphate N-acetyltransferase